MKISNKINGSGECILMKRKPYLNFELSPHTTLSAKWTRSILKIRPQNVKNKIKNFVLLKQQNQL